MLQNKVFNYVFSLLKIKNNISCVYMSMKCLRCLNDDPAYFYHGSKGWYCRKCISFGRAMIQEEQEPVSLHEVKENSEEYALKYPLTQKQKEISDACMVQIQNSDVLLKCVCGAGKTDVFPPIVLQFNNSLCFIILNCAKASIVAHVFNGLINYKEFLHYELCVWHRGNYLLKTSKKAQSKCALQIHGNDQKKAQGICDNRCHLHLGFRMY